MVKVDGVMKEVQIAYIGGGSRGWAWNIMADLALDSAMSGTVKLYDIDENAAKVNEVIGNKMNACEGVKSQWYYRAIGSLEEALTGADFVIISILPGTFEEMDSDVHVPEQYGIYQSVGDTVGPGGLLRSLRTIPMFEVIGEAIKKYAPTAWVINYTNPMTVCIRTLYEVFPEIKAFGCCHEVFGTQKLLTQALEKVEGIGGVNRREVDVTVIGLNHFTWITKASYSNIDLFPIYKKFVDKYYDDGFCEESDTNWMNDSFSSAQKVKMDLYKKYGYIAAAGDRHLAEFIGNEYLVSPEVVTSWMFGLTTVDSRKVKMKERIEKSKKMVSGELEVGLVASGEEGVELMKALCGLGEFKSNVNILNKGQISNIPSGTIVETNALFSFDCVTPLFVGEMPLELLTLTMPHVLNQEGIVKAGISRDYDMAFNVLCNDPLVTISYAETRNMFEKMMDNTKAYLPKEFFDSKKR